MNPLLIILLFLFHVLAIFSVGQILLHKRDPRAALGWIAVCLLVPIGGVIAYALFGIARTDSRAAKLMKKAKVQLSNGRTFGSALWSDSVDESAVKIDLAPEYQHLAMPGQHITGRDFVGGNAIFALYNGEQAYPAMLEAIEKATQCVYLSSYIFTTDSMGQRFIKALGDAAARGVDTRLLVDGVGSFFFRAQKSVARALMEQGVQVASFLPPTLIPPQFSINLRTHRKVLVCDDCAFTGGMNISQLHLVDTDRPDRVQDVHFLCKGPVVWQLQMAFLMDWSFVTGRMDTKDFSFATTCKAQGQSFCRVLMDGPGGSTKTIHDLFCSLISSARHSVRIMTPYFLPTAELAGALTAAVSRGVHVEVVLPALNNHCLVAWAMHHQLPDLVRRGVSIFWQQPPFAHTKLMLVDDHYALVGSANLDQRSLNLNFELVMETLDVKLVAELEDFFDITILRSTPMCDTRRMPLLKRLRNAVCWLFSPYL